MLKPVTLHLLLLFVSLQTNLCVFAQDTSFSVNEWVKKLKASDGVNNKELQEIRGIIDRKDSAGVYTCLEQLEKAGASNSYFKARLSFLKTVEAFRLGADVAKVKKLTEETLKAAYETGDDYLIAYVFLICGEIMQTDSELELGLTYYLQADEIVSQLEQKPLYTNYLLFTVGEMLYHTRDYKMCIDYTKKGLANGDETGATSDYYRIRYWNTIGQAYRELGQFDSALSNYQRSMQLVDKLNESTWRGINHVNIGEIYFLEKDYEKAKQHIQYEYKVKYTDEPNVSAFGLGLLSKINLVQGDKDSALLRIKQSLQLLKNSNYFLVQKLDYLQYSYYTAADVYRSLGNTDSFYHYSKLYSTLHDSLERVATVSSIKMAHLRIDNEKNYHTIRQLNRQKEAEELKRNFIITFLIALSVIVILILSRQKQKLKYKEKLALQERVAAKEQLESFTQNLIEKTILIEKLEKQISVNKNSTEQQQIVEELTHQTILTEDDWLKFKTLFEKAYSGFFTRLKEKVNDITLAEQRMAALTRLHLNTKEMAAVLGISPNSVIKAKQRLRQRFDFETYFHVEEFLTKL